ncbi:MAG: EthD domain-containing protein [Pseudomonadales bacterium]|nr:EthD domain-containing protein [Pseudomonadales bacterium]NNM11321.1 EthD domain-containing protein [Pseudomonadales bacterium]RZV52059.1 MAG: hypothetical protein EX270_09840 [Pseudomonadales bacterium]
MEKIMLLAQLPDNSNADFFRDSDMHDLSGQLLARADVHALTLQIEDSDVKDAAALRLEVAGGLPQLVVSLWLDSANAHEAIEAIVAQFTQSMEGYLVSESTVLNPFIKAGERGAGSTQVCSFRALPDLSHEEFIKRWRGDHTALALATQSTFGYRQNLVVSPLNPSSRPCSAIVEEHFPAAAMDSPEAFFDAIGDQERLQQHQQQMADSCARFIDFESINVVHMSEYVMKNLLS